MVNIAALRSVATNHGAVNRDGATNNSAIANKDAITPAEVVRQNDDANSRIETFNIIRITIRALVFEAATASVMLRATPAIP